MEVAMKNSYYHTARITKDQSYDGKFFFGVKTTNIFCRPSCPAVIAKEKNVVYFDSIFEALDQGYRPCLRCRPDIKVDYYSGNIDGTSVVKSALGMIYDGYLNDHSMSDLADELFVSDRHLRKLFIENLGIPPIKIAKYHKAIFAKKLLLFSKLSITEVAGAAGFGSTRQFNGVFKETFGATPSMLRKKGTEAGKNMGKIVLLLYYKEQFDFNKIVAFMKVREIKGIEVVTDNSYSRTFRDNGVKGYFTVSNNQNESALELNIHCDDIRCYMTVYYKVRKMFDLDTDLSVISKKLMKDEILLKGMDHGKVPRLPIAFDVFEFTIRAILGQQISIKAATTLTGRIAKKIAVKSELDYPKGLEYYFPTPLELQSADIEGIGIMPKRQETIRIVVNAIVDKLVSISSNQGFAQFSKDFSALKGIGDWTVNYVAMRGLGMIDSFPYMDLGIIKALTKNHIKPTPKQIKEIGEKWRPYRAYATLCLWHYEEKREET